MLFLILYVQGIGFSISKLKLEQCSYVSEVLLYDAVYSCEPSQEDKSPCSNSAVGTQFRLPIVCMYIVGGRGAINDADRFQTSSIRSARRHQIVLKWIHFST